MTGILYTLLTGDFPGYAIAGVEEDSTIIQTVLLMHGLLF